MADERDSISNTLTIYDPIHYSAVSAKSIVNCLTLLNDKQFNNQYLGPLQFTKQIVSNNSVHL